MAHFQKMIYIILESSHWQLLEHDPITIWYQRMVVLVSICDLSRKWNQYDYIFLKLSTTRFWKHALFVCLIRPKFTINTCRQNNSKTKDRFARVSRWIFRVSHDLLYFQTSHNFICCEELLADHFYLIYCFLIIFLIYFSSNFMVLANRKYYNILKYEIFWNHFVDLSSLIQNL